MLEIDRPETQYVLSGELSIAYQVFGHGDCDLLYVPGIIPTWNSCGKTPIPAPS